MKKLLFGMLLFSGAALHAQVAVSTQTSSPGPPPQTVTATGSFKKVPKITGLISCPGVPLDPIGNFLVVAGTSVTCHVALSAAVTAAGTLNLASADTTQFTVPASTTVAAGSTTSADFLITATP